MNMRHEADTVEERGGHALLWFALGTIAATYFHRRYYTNRATLRQQGERSELQSAVDEASQGASSQPIPSPATASGAGGGLASVSALGGNLSSADTKVPEAEEPYPEGNPTPLPTHPAPGG